jgi:DNA-binding NtrC family response regulator
MTDKPRPTILVVDDEAPQRELLGSFVESIGYVARTAESAEAALELLATEPPDMMLLDIRLPGMDGIEALAEIRRRGAQLPVLLVTAYADLRQAVDAVKGGAADYLAKPVDLDELQAAIVDAIGPAVAGGVESPSLPELPEGFICQSAAMRHVVQTAAVVAPSDVPVLVTGESGVGKEMVVQLIHRWSPRHAGPLVTANCGGLPESLVESELFGHTKGAFTGAATDRQGLFRSADGGTFFLDEIGELPLAMQPKLLRALESRQVTPVGSDKVVSVDVRLVAATNRDLERAVEAGEFRDDLYYRINVVEVTVPPLRARREDTLPLARHFASQFAGTPVRLSPQAVQCLLTYDWSGNVRELRNAIQRACLLCRGDVILPEHLPARIAAGAPRDAEAAQGRLSQVERATIRATLDECGGNRTRAAAKLGISRRTLIYKLRAMEDPAR